MLIFIRDRDEIWIDYNNQLGNIFFCARLYVMILKFHKYIPLKAS